MAASPHARNSRCLTAASPALYAEAESLRSRIRGVNSMLLRTSAPASRVAELEERRAGFRADLALMPARARLEEIEARYESAITAATAALYGRPGDYASETRSRNQLAKKRARRGLPRLETVAEEIRRLAEARVVAVVEQHPAFARVRADWAEAAELRARIEAHNDSLGMAA